jgi:hypothetical protein
MQLLEEVVQVCPLELEVTVTLMEEVGLKVTVKHVRIY